MRRFVLLSILTYGLLLLGMASLQPALIALSLPLALYLSVGLWRGPGALRLQVSRSLSSARVAKGDSVDIHLVVRNLGGTLEEVWLEDVLPDDIELEDGNNTLLTSLAAGGSVELDYTVRGARGQYRFAEVRVAASDLLGVFVRRALLAAQNTLLVLPDAPSLRRVAIRPLRRTHGFAGPIPARNSGPGVEFYGVREYQRGDPLRWINWRMTARHPRAFFTNEFEQERVADVGLILDARRCTNVVLGDESLLESAVAATASLARAFLEDGDRVGLLIYGWYLDWTFPGYGRVQRERILRALARARPGASVLFDTLDYLPVRYFPARSQIVIVSPLCADDYSRLVRLRARGYQVLIVSPDPVEFEGRHLPSDGESDLAVRIARLGRRLLLTRLRRAGIQIVDWPVDRPLEQVLRPALRRAPRPVRAGGTRP